MNSASRRFCATCPKMRRTCTRPRLREPREQVRASVARIVAEELGRRPTTPSAPERNRTQLDLHLALGAAWIRSKGYASDEVRRAYTNALQMCDQVCEPEQRFRALRGLCSSHYARLELRESTKVASRLLSLTRESGDPEHTLLAHRVMATVHIALPEHEIARQHLTLALDLYRPNLHRSYVLRYGEDPGLWCLCYMAWTSDWLGYRDRALNEIGQAITLARQLPARHPLAYVLANAALVHQQRREPAATLACAEEAMVVSEQQGIAQQLAWGSVHMGWALAASGKIEEGIALIEDGIAGWRAIHFLSNFPHFLILLADACRLADRPDRALRTLEEADDLVERTGHRTYEAEVHLQRAMRCGPYQRTMESRRRGRSSGRSRSPAASEQRPPNFAPRHRSRACGPSREAAEGLRSPRAGLRLVHRGLRDR